MFVDKQQTLGYNDAVNSHRELPEIILKRGINPMEINTEGIEQLFLAIANAIANLDIKTLDFDWLAELLTKYSAIWNPIWAAVNIFLENWFGF